MEHGCDVCRNFRPEANLSERTLTRTSFGEHTVMLCELHRCIALSHAVSTFEELREVFGEPKLRRSYVARRLREDGTGLDDERRRGRRSSDAP